METLKTSQNKEIFYKVRGRECLEKKYFVEQKRNIIFIILLLFFWFNNQTKIKTGDRSMYEKLYYIIASNIAQ